MKKNKKNMKKNRNGGKIFMAFSLTALLIGAVAAGNSFLNNANGSYDPNWEFADGYTINGISVGGLNRDEAEVALTSALVEKTRDKKIILKLLDEEREIDCNNYEIRSGIYEVLDEAYKISAAGKRNFDEYSVVKIASENKKNIEVNLLGIYEGLEEDIRSNLNDMARKPENAELIFTPDEREMFTVQPEKDGVDINEEETLKLVRDELENSNDLIIDVIYEEIESEIKSEDYLGKSELLVKFSTTLLNSQEGRRKNVEKSLSYFNGLKVSSGEKISFNEMTGPQTLENGYETAIVINNGVFTEGVGGGICQGSTTLYNALLISGIDIDEVFKHSLPVTYVPKALDAMVSEGYADLKFTNNRENPIYIKTYVKNDAAYVEIYGENLPNGDTLKVRSEEIKVLYAPEDKIIVDENGEYASKVKYKNEFYRLSEPRDGYEVVAYLERYDDNGKLIDSKVIRRETYEPKAGVVIEGRLVKQVAGGSEFD